MVGAGQAAAGLFFLFCCSTVPQSLALVHIAEAVSPAKHPHPTLEGSKRKERASKFKRVKQKLLTGLRRI